MLGRVLEFVQTGLQTRYVLLEHLRTGPSLIVCVLAVIFAITTYTLGTDGARAVTPLHTHAVSLHHDPSEIRAYHFPPSMVISELCRLHGFEMESLRDVPAAETSFASGEGDIR